MLLVYSRMRRSRMRRNSRFENGVQLYLLAPNMQNLNLFISLVALRCTLLAQQPVICTQYLVSISRFSFHPGQYKLVCQTRIVCASSDLAYFPVKTLRSCRNLVEVQSPQRHTFRTVSGHSQAFEHCSSDRHMILEISCLARQLGCLAAGTVVRIRGSAHVCCRSNPNKSQIQAIVPSH